MREGIGDLFVNGGKGLKGELLSNKHYVKNVNTLTLQWPLHTNITLSKNRAFEAIRIHTTRAQSYRSISRYLESFCNAELTIQQDQVCPDRLLRRNCQEPGQEH